MQTFSAETHGRHLVALILFGTLSAGLVGSLLWNFCGSHQPAKATFVKSSLRRHGADLKKKSRIRLTSYSPLRSTIYVAEAARSHAPRLFSYRLVRIDLTVPLQPALLPSSDTPPVPTRRPTSPRVQTESIAFIPPADARPTHRKSRTTDGEVAPLESVFEKPRLADTIVWERPINAVQFAA